MTYRQAVDYLFNRPHRTLKFGLDAIRDLLERIGNPQKTFPSIHVAGTNGKGSTVAMLESVLRASGFRTGCYTSPHLVDMRERIRVSGRDVPAAAVTGWMNRHLAEAESAGASVFEILTAMAFTRFRDAAVDIAVIETGLGGRLDATNTVEPVLTAITEIGKDHTEWLGDTLERIADEKAGILKPGVPCVAGTGRRRVAGLLAARAGAAPCPIVFSRRAVRLTGLTCTDRSSRFRARTENASYPDLTLGLAGRHQIDNAAIVLAAVDELRKAGWKIPDRAVRSGLRNVDWPGRLQVLGRRPTALIDSAHNPPGVETLASALKTLYHYKRLILVFGVLADKDYAAMLKTLAPLADRIVLTRPLSDRAMDPGDLAGLPALRRKRPVVIPDIGAAWKAGLAEAGPGDLVCGTGSIYCVGEIIKNHKLTRRRPTSH
jgi:dihydrofolate synthase / folylpolyglutamate synthase